MTGSNAAKAAREDGAAIHLRPATAADESAIVAIWLPGWLEAHEGRVPDALLEHRTPERLAARVPSMIDDATVALAGDSVAGFVVVRGDEVEQMYVGERFRGTGAAGALLTHAESRVARDFDRAWLAVVAGNDRAIGFYERQGWSDRGQFDHVTWTPGGGTIPVPCRRYEKLVRAAGEPAE